MMKNLLLLLKLQIPGLRIMKMKGLMVVITVHTTQRRHLTMKIVNPQLLTAKSVAITIQTMKIRQKLGN